MPPIDIHDSQPFSYNSGYPEKSIIPKREAEPLSHKDSLQNSSG